MNMIHDDERHAKMRAYNKERVEFLKEKGICIDCGKERAMFNRVRCPECLDKVKENAEATRSEASKEQRRQKQREKFKWCQANGICTNCLKRKATIGKSCTECYAKRKKKEPIKKRDLWAYTDKCMLCGGERIEGKKVCQKCYERCRKNLVRHNTDNSNHHWRKIQQAEIKQLKYKYQQH